MAESIPEELRFRTYTLRDLKAGKLEELIASTAKILPISTLRLKSMLNNPRALDTDMVMICVLSGEELVAYRMVVPDDLHLGLTKIHIAWYSGIWVKPDFRRKGIAKRMYEMFFDAWNGMLIATEFTPASGKAISSTGYFERPLVKNGIRIYYQSDTANILVKRYPILRFFKIFMKLADGFLNFFQNVRNKMKNKIKIPSNVRCSIADSPTTEAQKYIREYKSYSSANRRMPELSWILENLWIASDFRAKEESEKYYFSVYSEQFQVKFLEISQKSELKAMALLTLRDGILRIPYLFGENQNLEILSKCILKYAYENKVSLIVSYHELLNKYFLRHDNRRLYAKKTNRYYIVSKMLNKVYPGDSLVFADGDGDAVFV